MIYIVELESLEERYTSWWQSYIPEKIRQLGNTCEIISGETLTTTVETGTVLDAAGTNFFKASQIKKICELFYNKKIAPNSNFLIADIWFPGIEAIRYMSQLYQIPVHIWGIWHAGSSTMNDFAEPMHAWSKYFEVGFLNMCDGVFVGSDYSKESIVDRLLYFIPPKEAQLIYERIYAFGMPLNFRELQKHYKQEKKKIILFPHRPDIEKNPDKFINVMRGLSLIWEQFDDYKIIFSTCKKRYLSQDTWINALISNFKKDYKNVEIKENLPKEAYYNLLSESSLVISTTSEENFGYCVVEALALGCPVLMPNDFSHPEIVNYNTDYLYNTYDELFEKIPKILEKPIKTKELKEYVDPYEEVVRKWVEVMG